MVMLQGNPPVQATPGAAPPPVAAPPAATPQQQPAPQGPGVYPAPPAPPQAPPTYAPPPADGVVDVGTTVVDQAQQQQQQQQQAQPQIDPQIQAQLAQQKATIEQLQAQVNSGKVNPREAFNEQVQKINTNVQTVPNQVNADYSLLEQQHEELRKNPALAQIVKEGLRGKHMASASEQLYEATRTYGSAIANEQEQNERSQLTQQIASMGGSLDGVQQMSTDVLRGVNMTMLRQQQAAQAAQAAQQAQYQQQISQQQGYQVPGYAPPPVPAYAPPQAPPAYAPPGVSPVPTGLSNQGAAQFGQPQGLTEAQVYEQAGRFAQAGQQIPQQTFEQLSQFTF